MLVFGKEVIMPMEYWVPSLRIKIEERRETNKSMKNGMEESKKLDKDRMWLEFQQVMTKGILKIYHDSRLKKHEFTNGQLILQYNNRKKI